MDNKKISFDIENLYIKTKSDIVLGIDEAGRGCLVGPVVAACVWINQDKFPKNLLLKINDSKKLSEKKREEIFNELLSLPDDIFMFEYDDISAKIIDEINILQASLLAMKNSYNKLIKRLEKKDCTVLIDGIKLQMVYH